MNTSKIALNIEQKYMSPFMHNVYVAILGKSAIMGTESHGIGQERGIYDRL